MTDDGFEVSWPVMSVEPGRVMSVEPGRVMSEQARLGVITLESGHDVSRLGLQAPCTWPRRSILAWSINPGLVWSILACTTRPGTTRTTPPWVHPSHPALPSWQYWRRVHRCCPELKLVVGL